MRLGVIGGSGLYDLDGLTGMEQVEVKTPFGPPSDLFVKGTLSGREIFFLPRHGRGHRILPSEINHKANIYAFKSLGVERVMSISAVGSLRQELRPRDVVLPDQYFDRTKKSLEHTFFGNGIVAHISFGDPTCPEMRGLIASVARGVIAASPEEREKRVVDRGTYVNMEGPAFSTRAESESYRKLGFDVIGMTSLAEAKLCREAELCYQAMAMVTDYDCWHTTEEPVTGEMVLAHLSANVLLAKRILREVVLALPEERKCKCAQALSSAIFTDMALVSEVVKNALRPILGKYL